MSITQKWTKTSLSSISNIDQHKIIFPTVHNVICLARETSSFITLLSRDAVKSFHLRHHGHVISKCQQKMYTVVFKLGHALVKYPKIKFRVRQSVRGLDHIPCLRVSGTIPKFRDLMIRFQENPQVDVRREAWRDPIS